MLYHFNEMTVSVQQRPNGEFTAVGPDNHDGRPMGFGQTQLEAIADLADQLRECGELED